MTPFVRRIEIARALAVLAAAALGVTSATARADDSAAADALFQQAKTLTEQKRWAEACPKFEASYKLDRTLGTLLNLADCEEHLEHLAGAWAHWGEAVELAGKAGDKRADFAAGHRAALTPRLPMIRIDASAEKTTLEVYRDGVKIDPAAYAVPLPSDPGKHVITARRGAETLAQREVVAREASTVVVTLDLAAIEKAAAPPAPVGAPQSSNRTAGFVVGGIGVATVAAAGALEIAAIVSKGAAGAPGACVNKVCTPSGIDAINKARTLATAGQWVGIGGILVSAVGVTLVLTAPRPAARPPLTVTGWATPTGAGLVLGGAL
jgi:tetratricopeptide (TPR) repeat protein